MRGLFTEPHLYPAPQDVGFRVWCRTGAIGRFWPYSPEFMQDRGYEVPRISLLGTSVNTGKWLREKVAALLGGGWFFISAGQQHRARHRQGTEGCVPESHLLASSFVWEPEDAHDYR
jgi:hypothetical protein